MKRWFKRIAALSATLLAALTLLRAMAYTLRPDDIGVRTRLEGFYAEEERSLDVVMIGSSAAYAFFSPLRLWQHSGLTSYLYATPNQSVPMIRYAIEECRKTQPDALFLVELRAMLATPEDRAAIAVDLRRMTDNMPYSLLRSRMLAALSDPGERLSMELDLIKFHTRWKSASLSDLRFDWGKADPLKGYQFDTLVEPVALPNWDQINAQIAPDEQNERDLRELLAWCGENSVRAVFVVTPYALSRRQEKVYNAIGRMVEETGYAFFNMSRRIGAIGLNADTDYSDFRHVNTLGMTRCTDALAAYLAEQGVAPAEKSEACKRSWQRLSEIYAVQEAQALAQIQTTFAPKEDAL